MTDPKDLPWVRPKPDVKWWQKQPWHAFLVFAQIVGTLLAPLVLINILLPFELALRIAFPKLSKMAATYIALGVFIIFGIGVGTMVWWIVRTVRRKREQKLQ